MDCYFCHTSFFYTSYSGPAEDCDCGLNATHEDVRHMDDEEFGIVKARSEENLQSRKDEDDDTQL